MSNLDFEKTATRVSVLSIAGNAALSLFKLLAGIFAHSGAMISDAVHSASVSVFKFNLEHCIGKLLNYLSFDFNNISL